MLKLFYSPGACSLASHIVLRELELPFELQRVSIADGDHLKPEFIEIHHRARVPVLIVEGKAVSESPAILTWLGQQGKMLFPEKGTFDAIRCSEWLAWLSSSVHISFAQIWRAGRFSSDTIHEAAIQQQGKIAVKVQFDEIEYRLVDCPFALGGEFTVVDPYLLVFYRWGERIGIDMRKDYPIWTAHSERMVVRPAVKEAIIEEGIEIWSS
jgi:glutathione S-transferase